MALLFLRSICRPSVAGFAHIPNNRNPTVTQPHVISLIRPGSVISQYLAEI